MTTFESIREDEEFSAPEQKVLDGRKVEYRNFDIEAMDPYGFWYIRAPKGMLPEWMTGAYTSPDRARADIDVYLTKKKPTVKEKYDMNHKGELNDNDKSRDSNRN